MGGRGFTRQRWRAMILCYPLLLGLLMPMQRRFSPALADPTPENCETSYPGLTYCVEDAGDIHLVIVDLNDPHVRFEMVMAEDLTRVDTDRRERIEEMVTRSPYQDQNVVVAINADYFGHNHGPEGLTVKNGLRLDVRAPNDDPTNRQENPHALWRSSLTISRFNQVSLGRKTLPELKDPRAYRERFYNAVGGGPLILNQGVIIPNAVACLLERFPVGACRRTIQTAAGLSEDERWLYLAVGQGRDIEGFAELLREYGAFTAIKLDGGGSSQLWYDGEMRHDTQRAVGNALFVFYSPVPRHDARVVSSSSFAIAEPGEHVPVRFEIQNSGFLGWEPDLGYRFKNVQGWPVLGPPYWRLPEPVSADSALETTSTVIAPHRPGIYESEWQLVHRNEPIGPRLWFGLAVVPPGQEGGALQQQIQSQIDRSQIDRWRLRPASEQEWATLRSELEQVIWQRAEAELREALCQGGIDAETKWGWWAPLFRVLAC